MYVKNGPAYFLEKYDLLAAVKSFIIGYLRAFPGWHSVDQIANFLKPVLSPIIMPHCPPSWSLKLFVASACGDLARDHVGVSQTCRGKIFAYKF